MFLSRRSKSIEKIIFGANLVQFEAKSDISARIVSARITTLLPSRNFCPQESGIHLRARETEKEKREPCVNVNHLAVPHPHCLGDARLATGLSHTTTG